jgi:hypothetical protein
MHDYVVYGSQESFQPYCLVRTLWSSSCYVLHMHAMHYSISCSQTFVHGVTLLRMPIHLAFESGHLIVLR